MIGWDRPANSISPGAFVAAPIGGLLWALAAFSLRIGYLWTSSKIKGHRFDAFDRPTPPSPSLYVGEHDEPPIDQHHGLLVKRQKGKFI